MTARTHTPRSLKGRLQQFFIDNPDEELNLVQIAVKFGASYFYVIDVVAELRAEGLLESVRVVRLRTKGIAKETTT